MAAVADMTVRMEKDPTIACVDEVVEVIAKKLVTELPRLTAMDAADCFLRFAQGVGHIYSRVVVPEEQGAATTQAG